MTHHLSHVYIGMTLHDRNGTFGSWVELDHTGAIL